MKILVTIFLALVLTSISGIAQQKGKYSVAGIDNDAAVEKFFNDLQEAVGKNERAKVTSMVAYPIKVRMGRHIIMLRKKSDLLEKYDSVFNRKIKEAVRKQKVTELFVNWRGVMIGNGEIWFNQLDDSKNIRITAINN